MTRRGCALGAAALIFAPGCAAWPRGQTTSPATAGPLPSAVVVPGDLEARTMFSDISARASRLGAGSPSIVSAGPAVDNQWLGSFVEVPPDVCLLAYARASSSVEDIDVAVYSEEGTSLAVDEGRDVHPTVVLCPPHPPRVYVAAHVVEGEGLAAVGVQLVPKDRAEAVAKALGAHGGPDQGPRAADAWPGLDETVREHRAELGGSWEEFKRIALTVDARVPTYAAMPFGADECIDAVVVPDEDVAFLDVEAVDEEGRVLARAGEGMGARTLTVCSPIAMGGTLLVRPHAGRGLAAVVLARAGGDTASDLSSRPQIAWVAPVQTLEDAMRQRNLVLSKNGYSGPTFTTSGALSVGRRVTVPVDPHWLGPVCGRIDVVAGKPLALLGARLWSDAGSLLASAEASSSLALFACSQAPARLEIEAHGRPGPFAVLVRPERWKHPSFSAHPLASSRMLARAATGEQALFPGDEALVRELTLEAGRLISWTEIVPPARCLRVTVGVQGNGIGVELRAFDGADSEVDRAAAALAANVRVCAPSAPRAVRFELRGSVGRLAAVLGERLEAIEPR